MLPFFFPAAEIGQSAISSKILLRAHKDKEGVEVLGILNFNFGQQGCCCNSSLITPAAAASL